MLEVQNAHSARIHAGYAGKTVRVLVDGESGDGAYPLSSRTDICARPRGGLIMDEYLQCLYNYILEVRRDETLLKLPELDELVCRDWPREPEA